MELDGKGHGVSERLDLPFALKAVETVRQDDGVEVGVFEGLAATFGDRDRTGDILEPGAFSDSVAGPERIKMLWQHDARAPIGVWERIVAVPEGLAVKGRLILEVQRAREALALLKAGAIDALSIGFSVPRDGAEFDRETGVRRIKTIDLWEVSIVTFPANPKARIDRVKARLNGSDLPSEREFERFLMRDAGFSRSQARAVLGSGYKAFLAKQDAGEGLDELAAGIRRIASRMATGGPADTDAAGRKAGLQPRPAACRRQLQAGGIT